MTRVLIEIQQARADGGEPDTLMLDITSDRVLCKPFVERLRNIVLSAADDVVHSRIVQIPEPEECNEYAHPN